MQSPTSGGIRPFREDDEAALRNVMKEALAVDAFPGFSAWDLDCEAVSIMGAPGGVAVAIEDGVVCGYVSPRHEDLTIHPQFRRRGHGRRLLAAGLDLAAKAGWEEIRLYVPLGGAGPAFAGAMGMIYRSSLWRLDLAPETTVPEPVFPDDVVVRTLGDWLPLERFVDLLNDSFAEHPGPVSWTFAQIQPPTHGPTSTHRRSCCSRRPIGPTSPSASCGLASSHSMTARHSQVRSGSSVCCSLGGAEAWVASFSAGE